MSFVYLQRGWDHSAGDGGSAGGSAGCPALRAARAWRLQPSASPRPNTRAPARRRGTGWQGGARGQVPPARQAGRRTRRGPLEAETKPVSVRQRQAGSAGCRSPALPGRSRRLVPESRSAALRGGARGGRR